MESKSKWADSEVKALFNLVEEHKKNNQNLLAAFKQYAVKSGRQKNSVRNYYYAEVASLIKNKERAKKLGIDIHVHQVQKSIKFSEDETSKLVEEILRLKCLGFSVRKACLKLAGGDVDKMVRLQNKFRSECAKKSNLKNDILAKIKNKGLNDKIDNVIVIPKREDKKLSDSEINSLFFGLLKLVKKNALASAQQNLIREAEFASSTLRKTLVRLAKSESDNEGKNILLQQQQLKIAELKKENLELKLKLAKSLANEKTNQVEMIKKEFKKATKKAN